MAFETIAHLLEPEQKPKFGSGTIDHLLEGDSTPISDVPANRTFSGTMGDLGVSTLKGAVELPQAVVGLADIPTGGRVGKALESVGYKPQQTLNTLDELYSPAQQYANKQVQNAQGFLPTLGAIAQNPSTIATTGIESLPSMGGGGVIAKGAMRALPAILPKLSVPTARIVSGAIGEGAISAGATEEQIRNQTPDKLTTPEQSGLAALSGVGTGLIGGVSGKLANKLGIGDIDTLAVGGAGRATNQGILSSIGSIGKGAASEGFEEAAQSAQEQALQNIALNKPVMEGVGNAAAMGAATGGVIGGITGPLSRAASQADQSGVYTPDTPPQGRLPQFPDWGDDEIINYNYGSSLRASELYSEELNRSGDPAKAKAYVDNIVAKARKDRLDAALKATPFKEGDTVLNSDGQRVDARKQYLESKILSDGRPDLAAVKIEQDMRTGQLVNLQRELGRLAPYVNDVNPIELNNGSVTTPADIFRQMQEKTGDFNDWKTAYQLTEDFISKNARSTTNSTDIPNGAPSATGMGAGEQPSTQSATTDAEAQGADAGDTNNFVEPIAGQAPAIQQPEKQPVKLQPEFKPQFIADNVPLKKPTPATDLYAHILSLNGGDGQAAQDQVNRIIQRQLNNKQEKNNALRPAGTKRQSDSPLASQSEGAGRADSIPPRGIGDRQRTVLNGGIGGNASGSPTNAGADIDAGFVGTPLRPQSAPIESIKPSFQYTHTLNDGYDTPVIKTDEDYIDANGDSYPLDSDAFPVEQPKVKQNETKQTTSEAKTATQKVPDYNAETDKLRVQVVGTTDKGQIKLKRVQSKNSKGEWVNAKEKTFNLPIKAFNAKYNQATKPQNNKENLPATDNPQGDMLAGLGTTPSETPPVQSQEPVQEKPPATDALETQPENDVTGGVGDVLPNPVQAQKTASDAEEQGSGDVNPRNLPTPNADALKKQKEILKNLSIKRDLGIDPEKALKNAKEAYYKSKTDEDLSWWIALHDKVKNSEPKEFLSKKASDNFISKTGLNNHRSFKNSFGKWRQIYSEKTPEEQAAGILGAKSNSLIRDGLYPVNFDSFEEAYFETELSTKGLSVHPSKIKQLAEAGIGFKKQTNDNTGALNENQIKAVQPDKADTGTVAKDDVETPPEQPTVKAGDTSAQPVSDDGVKITPLSPQDIDGRITELPKGEYLYRKNKEFKEANPDATIEQRKGYGDSIRDSYDANLESAKTSKAKPSTTSPAVSQDSDNINSKIDEEASKAATSPLNDIPQPTDAQKEAGNYQKGHINLQGLNITIENPKGSTRSGKDSDGKAWSVEMKSHYGYIKRTVGADDEQVDVFIGPYPESNKVFVVNQIDPKTGKFDEHKVMLGFNSQGTAKIGYNRNYAKGWKGAESITAMSMDEFKKELASGKLDKPLKKPSEPAQDNAPKKETVTRQPEKEGSTAAQDGVNADAAKQSTATNADKDYIDGKISGNDYTKLKGIDNDDFLDIALKKPLSLEASTPYTKAMDGILSYAENKKQALKKPPTGKASAINQHNKRVGLYNNAIDTVKTLKKNFEHPFNNSLQSRLPASFYSKFNDKFNGIATGDKAKKEYFDQQGVLSRSYEVEQVNKYLDSKSAVQQPEASTNNEQPEKVNDVKSQSLDEVKTLETEEELNKIPFGLRTEAQESRRKELFSARQEAKAQEENEELNSRVREANKSAKFKLPYLIKYGVYDESPSQKSELNNAIFEAHKQWADKNNVDIDHESYSVVYSNRDLDNDVAKMLGVTEAQRNIKNGAEGGYFGSYVYHATGLWLEALKKSKNEAINNAAINSGLVAGFKIGKLKSGKDTFVASNVTGFKDGYFGMDARRGGKNYSLTATAKGLISMAEQANNGVFEKTGIAKKATDAGKAFIDSFVSSGGNFDSQPAKESPQAKTEKTDETAKNKQKDEKQDQSVDVIQEVEPEASNGAAYTPPENLVKFFEEIGGEPIPKSMLENNPDAKRIEYVQKNFYTIIASLMKTKKITKVGTC